MALESLGTTPRATRSPHVVHLLGSHDARAAEIVRTLVARTALPSATPQLLVVTPSTAVAAQLAHGVNADLAATPHRLVPLNPGPWSGRRLSLGIPAVVASAATLLTWIQRAALKLDAVQCVVWADLDQMLERSTDVLEALMAELPKGDRVALTTHTSSAVTDFLERHARKSRAVTYDSLDGAPGVHGRLESVICAASEKGHVLAELLDTAEVDHTTVWASSVDQDAARGALDALGISATDALVELTANRCPDDAPLLVVYSPADPGWRPVVEAAHPRRTIALVAPHEFPAFERLAGTRAAPARLATAVGRAAAHEERQRLELRGALQAPGGLHREVLALAPLFSEFDPALVAAALLRQLEGRSAAPEVVVPEAAPRIVTERPSPPAPPRARPPAPSAMPGGMTALFLGVGARDGATKGDIVGAIAGESGIPSSQIGRITLRDSHTVVEVESAVAQRVIDAVSGKTIRGRVVAARLDRGPTDRDAASGGERRERGPRPRRDAEPRGRTGFGSRSVGTREHRGARPHGAADARDRRSTGSRGTGFRQDDGERPRGGRGGARSAPGPSAMRESREWRDRGDRLRHAKRRPPRGDA